MSIRESLKSLFTAPPDRYAMSRKAAPVSTEYFGPLGQRNADWSGVRTGEKVRDVWSKCATAFACLTLLADAVAESPLRVYRTVDGKPEEQPDHRARTLIANPNPMLSEAEFMVLTVMTAGLHGYAVTEKVRSSGRVPVELWPLRPDWLKRERTNSGAQFVYRRPATPPRIIADDDLIITPYYHDPSHMLPGLSPLHIIAREVGIDVSLTDLLKVFIDNGGIPPWAVEIPDSAPDQAQVDAFREKWAQTFAGIEAYRKMAVLFGGMKLVKIGDSIGDMAWPDLRGLTEMKICQGFRVPADLVQVRDTVQSGSLTTTEMDGGMRYLQNHGAQPLRMRIDGSFSRSLLPDFTGGDNAYSLEFDTSAIMALQEDRDALHTRVRADWDSGLLTLNEARGETGRADLGPAGEVFKQSFTTLYVALGDLGGGASVPASTITPRQTPALAAGKTERVYRDVKALSPVELETRAGSLAATRREREKLAEIGTRKLRAFFRAQGKRIVDSLPKSGAAVTVKAVAVNWDDEEDLLRALLTQFYTAAGERAFGSVSTLVGVELDWTLANPNVARIMDQLGLRITEISETTRTDVVDVIAAAQADGASLTEIADRLTGLFEETYKGRALTIARTETQASYNLASQIGYQESGVVDSVEMVDNPDHPDDYGASDGLTCAERDGMIVPVADMHLHVAGEHINGSLAFIPILSRPLGVE